MRYIYLVFSSTTTKVEELIKTVTGHRYNHASISLNKQLSPLYSFSRYHYCAPLYAGFTEESPLRFVDASVKVYRFPVSNEQYSKVKRKIRQMKNTKDLYIYNIVSAATFPVRKRVRIRQSNICIDFAVEILKLADIPGVTEDYYSFEQLEEKLADNLWYDGDFILSPKADWGDDKYPEDIPIPERISGTASNFLKLLKRKLMNTDK